MKICEAVDIFSDNDCWLTTRGFGMSAVFGTRRDLISNVSDPPDWLVQLNDIKDATGLMCNGAIIIYVSTYA